METEHASDTTSARRQAAIDKFKQAREAAMAAYKVTVDEAWHQCCEDVGQAGDDLMAELEASSHDDPPDYEPPGYEPGLIEVTPPDDEAAWEQERNDNPPAAEASRETSEGVTGMAWDNLGSGSES